MRLIILVVVCALLTACTGPTEPAEIIEVSGRVTVAGEPVGQVGVRLASAQQCYSQLFGYSSPCVGGWAVTDADGRYTLVVHVHDGCLSGTVVFGNYWETEVGPQTSPRYGYTGCGPHVISHDFPAAE
jgi:hypothetical protein